MLTDDTRFSSTVTWVEVTVHKFKFVTILDTGSPVKNLLAPFKKNKNELNLNHLVVYGTAGIASTKFIVAYLALPLFFVKIFLTSLAVVFKDEGQKVIISTQLLIEIDRNFNHHEEFVSLLRNRILLALANLPVIKGL